MTSTSTGRRSTHKRRPRQNGRHRTVVLNTRKLEEGGRSSPTRRQPVSKRKTNKTVIQRLDESDLFNNGIRQESEHYKVSFQVKGWRGANVFVTHDESEFLLKKRALNGAKFPISDRLRDFALGHTHSMECGKEHRPGDFAISSEYLEDFIELIRSGLQENSKSGRASRSSPTRRQPVGKRTTSKSTAHMSPKQQLEASGLFDEGKLQQSTGTVSFQVTGRMGATIYVTKSQSEVQIFDRAFRKNNFPNNRKLYAFVLGHKHGMVRAEDNPNRTYKLKGEHIEAVIELIRSGLRFDPESRQTSLSTRTSRKRSRDRSVAGETVLEKFKRAFPRRHKETKSNYTVSLGKGATVYFRKTSAGPNEARIHSGRVNNFPNASKLKSYLKRSSIPIDPSESHPDYKIGPKQADRVIAILKELG